MHVACRQGFAGVPHWDPSEHSTQDVDVLSQYGVGVVQADGGLYCPFALQVSTALPLQVSVPGVHAQHAPVPLHVPPAHPMPFGLDANPQVLLVHAATRQSLAGDGQSEAAVQATQAAVCGSQCGVAPAQAGCVA